MKCFLKGVLAENIKIEYLKIEISMTWTVWFFFQNKIEQIVATLLIWKNINANEVNEPAVRPSNIRSQY